jgi:poly(3-hydroxyoctanoate) depolymerase
MKFLFARAVAGDPASWQPVADRLPTTWQKTLLGWPGLGNQPPAPDVNGWDDLYRTVEERIDDKVAIVAQSMGGVLPMQAALAHPQSLSHLVLTATSGGIDLTPFHPQDWRDEYRRSNPHAPPGSTNARPDTKRTCAASRSRPFDLGHARSHQPSGRRTPSRRAAAERKAVRVR